MRASSRKACARIRRKRRGDARGSPFSNSTPSKMVQRITYRRRCVQPPVPPGPSRSSRGSHSRVAEAWWRDSGKSFPSEKPYCRASHRAVPNGRGVAPETRPTAKTACGARGHRVRGASPSSRERPRRRSRSPDAVAPRHADFFPGDIDDGRVEPSGRTASRIDRLERRRAHARASGAIAASRRRSRRLDAARAFGSARRSDRSALGFFHWLDASLRPR